MADEDPARSSADNENASADSDNDSDAAGVAGTDRANGSDAPADVPAADAPDDDTPADVGSDDDTESGSGLTDQVDGLTDPSEALTDPADKVPAAEAPSVGVDVPDGPDVPEPEEVPEGLRAEFWEIVLAFNVALFALALGSMLVVFEGDATTGGVSLAVGTLALGYGFWQYRTREHAP